MLNPIRLLYVEDNDDLRATIGVLLEDDGRSVHACATAEEALVALEAGVYDVLVTDVSLPRMSGVELARQALADHPALWVVLCSGYEFGAEIRRFGPRVRAIAKPFEVEDLESLLAEVSAAVHAERA